MKPYVLPVLLLVLSACGGPAQTPEAQCKRQAYDDPAVVEIYTRTNGAYTYPWTERDQLLMAKEQAYVRCMREKGLLPPGGVEPVQKR